MADPLIQRMDWDIVDHVVGLRNVYGATFYEWVTPISAAKNGTGRHALGFGLRIETWPGSV